MNFKKNFKRFFTLSRSAEGFTLVELIVVIAILGLLAGITIPAYGQYVEKSQIAVDKQNVALMNNVLAVACAENSVSNTAVSRIDLTDTYQIDYLVASENGDGIMGAFNTYFEGTTFNVYKPVFNPQTHLFAFAVAYGYGESGGYVYIAPEDLDKFEQTTFANPEILGVAGTLQKVDGVTTFVAALGDSAMDKVYESPAFLAHAAKALGITLQPGEEGYDDAVNAKMTALIAEMQKRNPEMTIAQAKEQIYANAAVIHAAQNATDASVMTKEEINSFLTTDNADVTMIANLYEKGQPSKALAQAALAYGMYTAYAHATNQDDLVNSTTPNVILTNGSLNDDAFQTWVSSPQGQADLEGYLSALNMINSSSNDPNAVSELLVAGFADPDLIDLIEGAMKE